MERKITICWKLSYDLSGILAIVSLWVKVTALTLLWRKEAAVEIKPFPWGAKGFKERTGQRCPQLDHFPQPSSLLPRKLWLKVVGGNISVHTNIWWLSIDTIDMYDVCNKVLNSSRSTTHDYSAVHAYQNPRKQISYPGVSTPLPSFPLWSWEVQLLCLGKNVSATLQASIIKENKTI